MLLYLHVPFCEELCPYCSFNRIEFQEGYARLYFDALRKEILMHRDLGYDFNALYVGGGTPADAAPSDISAGAPMQIRSISTPISPK